MLLKRQVFSRFMGSSIWNLLPKIMVLTSCVERKLSPHWNHSWIFCNGWRKTPNTSADCMQAPPCNSLLLQNACPMNGDMGVEPGGGQQDRQDRELSQHALLHSPLHACFKCMRYNFWRRLLQTETALSRLLSARRKHKMSSPCAIFPFSCPHQIQSCKKQQLKCNPRDQIRRILVEIKLASLQGRHSSLDKWSHNLGMTAVKILSLSPTDLLSSRAALCSNW